MLPLVGHRFFHGQSWELSLLSVALFGHVLLDGGILSTQNPSDGLAWAVIAHRLPVALRLCLRFEARGNPCVSCG